MHSSSCSLFFGVIEGEIDKRLIKADKMDEQIFTPVQHACPLCRQLIQKNT